MMPLLAAVVTHRRPRELRRLLESLADSSEKPDVCVVADHAPDGSSQSAAAGLPFPVEILEDASNPGPGAGWAHASAAHPASDVLFLDDDVVLPSHAIARMRAHLDPLGMVAPLLEDADGHLWGFPEPQIMRQRRLIRQAKTPAEAERLLGAGPHPMVWCTGACVLIAKNLFQRIGPHRRDFWMLGEDLELSMRAAAQGHAVFLGDVSVPHLPPESSSDPLHARIKFCSLLQNLCYLSVRSPHRTHMIRYLPGNFRRYFRTFGWNAASLTQAWRCFYGGILRGEPAGGPTGTTLRKRLSQRT